MRQNLLNRKNLLRILCLSFALTANILAAGGRLDSTFNAGLTNNGNSGNIANVVAVQPDGKILVGGGFFVVDGRSSQKIVRLNADSTIDRSFNIGAGFTAGGFVNAIAVLPNGQILVGGNFLDYNGVERNYLVRLNSNGSLDTTFNQGGTGFVNQNGSVNAIALQPNGQILIAGFFSEYNGVTTRNLARLHSNGSLDAAFAAALGTGFDGNGPVQTIAVETDGQIVVGGFFTVLNGATANRIVRFNANGTRDTTFSTNNGMGFNSLVYSVALQTDGRIVVGGAFTAFNGTARNRLARLNADGTLDTNFVSVVLSDGAIESIAIQPDGKILAGGILSFGVSERRYIARLEASNGALDLSFNVGMGGNGGAFGSLTLSGSSIFVTGNFLNFNNFNTAELAKLNADGSVNTNFSVVMGDTGIVRTMFVQSDDRILIGGAFVGVNQDFRGGLARFNADGTTDTAFITGLDPESSVQAIAVQSDGKILIGGFNLGELGESSVFRLNANGSLDTTFNSACNGIINDIAVQPDGKILIGGQGFILNGVTMLGIARLNANGTTDATFNIGAGFSGGGAAPESIVLQPDGKILVGGNFTGYNGTIVNRIARLNPDGSLDTAFTTNTGIGVDGGIYVLALQPDGKIVAGGFFSNFNGVSSNMIFRLNANGSRDAGFNVGKGFDNVVYALQLQPNGGILAGGDFRTYNGTDRKHLARLGANGSLDTSFEAGLPPNNPVYAAGLQTNRKIIIGGYLTAPYPRNGIARLLSGRTVTSDFDDDGRADISVFRPSNGFWYTLRSSDGGFRATQFGSSTDKIAPADYDGDGIVDIAVFRPSNGVWYLLRSSLGFTAIQYGINSDIPVPDDYDGDGRAELAVYRSGIWFTFNLVSNQSQAFNWGLATDKPVVGDFSGDGRADFTVFRPSNGVWYVLRSSGGSSATQWGVSTDRPAPADYDGDGIIDIAVFRPSNGTWYLLQSSAGFSGTAFGIASDTPVPADYDGDGRSDIAVYRGGTWFLLRSTAGFTGITFGAASDVPIPSAYIP